MGYIFAKIKNNNGKQTQGNADYDQLVFVYTLIVTFAITAALIIIDYIVNNYCNYQEYFRGAYEMLIPAVLTLACGVIVRNVLLTRKRIKIHRAQIVVSAIFIPIMCMMYAIYIVIENIYTIILTGVFAVCTAILTILAYREAN